MKHLAAPLVLLLVALAAPAWAAPRHYLLQKDQSTVGFTWFFGKDAVRGRMPVAAADIVIDFDQASNSRFQAAVDVTGAEAGFPFASQAMKGPKVLWSERFPRIEFVSRRVRPAGAGAVIEGDMTIRGVTRPVTMEAEVFRQRGTEAGDLRLLSIRLTTRVSRSAFGADGWSDMVGDEVRLEILARIEEDG